MNQQKCRNNVWFITFLFIPIYSDKNTTIFWMKINDYWEQTMLEMQMYENQTGECSNTLPPKHILYFHLHAHIHKLAYLLLMPLLYPNFTRYRYHEPG